MIGSAFCSFKNHRGQRDGKYEGARSTHNEELVGGFLPLLVHGVRRRLGGQADSTEDGDAHAETSRNTPEDSCTGTGRVNCARAMGTKSDPVRYQCRPVSPSIDVSWVVVVCVRE